MHFPHGSVYKTNKLGIASAKIGTPGGNALTDARPYNEQIQKQRDLTVLLCCQNLKPVYH